MEKYSTDGDKLTCEFTRRMDTDTCKAVYDDVMNRVGQAKGSVVFDMSNVDFVASSFLGICADVVKRIGKDRFSLINIQPNVKKVFKIARLDSVMHIS